MSVLKSYVLLFLPLVYILLILITSYILEEHNMSTELHKHFVNMIYPAYFLFS